MPELTAYVEIVAKVTVAVFKLLEVQLTIPCRMNAVAYSLFL